MSSALDLSLGALQVGVGLCCFLVGIVTLQTLNYFRSFDKLLVSSDGRARVFDLLHSAFLMHTLYEYGVTFYGHPERMALSVWSLNTSIIFQGLVALCVQSFFCLRILRISGSWILTALCMSLCLARFCMSMTVVSFDFKYYSFAVIETRYQTFTAAALAVIAASDVSIAASLVGSLLKQKSGFASTNKLIDKIIGLVVGTGLLTSILAVIDVITFVTMQNFVWLAVLVIIVKVYTNSLLASLNERMANRKSELSFGSEGTRPSKIEWRVRSTPGGSYCYQHSNAVDRQPRSGANCAVTELFLSPLMRSHVPLNPTGTAITKSFPQQMSAREWCSSPAKEWQLVRLLAPELEIRIKVNPWQQSARKIEHPHPSSYRVDTGASTVLLLLVAIQRGPCYQ
ncbi:hypothetical protein AURDEDRAFT_122027 [Auricularia subglabra TFB-10046 SS5]|nr:hypothetical protein AURDEDRAFT_122027 [Auricularia subglabra TFB-10046 SS5]